MPETEIDVPELIGIGAAVGKVAARLEATSADVEGWASSGEHAVDGSLVCASEMVAAAYAWAREIKDLGAAVRRYGADLKRTAQDYRAYDDLTAQQVRQVGDPTFGPGRS